MATKKAAAKPSEKQQKVVPKKTPFPAGKGKSVEKVKVEAPSNAALKQIALLAEQQLSIESTIAELKQDLADMEIKLTDISDKALPDAMSEAHLKEFTLDNGRQVSVSDEVAISIINKNKEALFTWLEKHGFGGLIKNVVSVPFGRDDEKAVTSLEGTLKKLKLDFTTDKKIHAGTAKAFVKEQLAAGKDVPLKLFNAFPYQRAKIR